MRWLRLVALMALGSPFARTDAQDRSSGLPVLGDSVLLVELTRVHQLNPSTIGTSDGSTLAAATLTDNGWVVTMTRRLGSSATIQAVDATGRSAWRRDLGNGFIQSMLSAGDTLATIESGEHRELVFRDLTTGAQQERIAMPEFGSYPPRLRGRTGEFWLLENTTEPGRITSSGDVGPYPVTELLGFNRSEGTWKLLASHADSSPTARPMADVSLRPPFAPLVQFTANEALGVLFSPGDRWIVQQLAVDGQLVDRFSVRPLGDRLSPAQWELAARDFAANPPLMVGGVSPTFFDSLARLDPSARGRTIGRVLAGADGSLLLHRRDADSLSSGTLIASVWDAVLPSLQLTYRFRLNASQSLISYAGEGRLLVLRDEGGGSRVLEVLRITEWPR